MTGQDFGDNAQAWGEWLRRHPVRSVRPALGPGQEAVAVAIAVGLKCLVRLADGTEVAATVPRSVARDMFRIVAGDRMQVRVLEPGCSQVVGFAEKQKA